MPDSGSSQPEAFPTPLVEAEWLVEHLDHPDLRVLDATIEIKRLPVPHIKSGRKGWKKAHVPGAAFADIKALSQAQGLFYPFALPSPEHFAGAMGELGVGSDTRVVVYDSRQSMWAARVWWMLRYFGFDNAAVLNGGWSAWSRGGYPICSNPCSYPAAEPFETRIRPEMVVDRQGTLEAIENPSTCIVSALGRRQHRGERNEFLRRGHIPGARNVTAWEILDRDTQRYRSIAELEEKFGEILEAERVITYCGSGIAAASDALALHLLGHSNVAIYNGGLVEWNLNRLPLERGD
jgi:thiosulfate/3-mercaptopyruvate sulfurtransferase